MRMQICFQANKFYFQPGRLPQETHPDFPTYVYGKDGKPLDHLTEA